MIWIYVFAFLLAIAIAAACYLRYKRSSYPSWDEIDENATLKVGGSKKRLEEFASKPIDYIIVGSGLGGLTCASLLSKAGYRVLVLEQHDTAGGATHSFEENGFSFDVGVHYLGERLTSNLSPVRRLFDAVSDGKLEWSKCADDYDHAVNMQDGTDIPISSDVATKLKRLEAAFPGSGTALRRYRRACRIAQVVSGGAFVALKLLPSSPPGSWGLFGLLGSVLESAYSWAAKRSAREVMLNCGLSEAALGGCSYLYGDYGLPPGEAPFLTQALLETHYDGGAFFPRGGSSSIAKTIVAAIQRRGGAVMVRAPVDEILVDAQSGGRGLPRATGVRCRGVELHAKRGVISNAGAFNTYERLLKKAAPSATATARSAFDKEPGSYEASVQLVYLFVGLDASAQELGLPGANYWLLHGWDHDANWRKFKKADTYEDLGFLPAVFLSMGSAKDDAHGRGGDGGDKGSGDNSSKQQTHPANTATLQLLAPVRMKWFEDVAAPNSKVKHRGKAYDDLKAVWQKRLLEEFLYRMFPQTKGRVVHSSVATPLTTNHYLNALEGETYGLSHTLARFKPAVQRGPLHSSVPGVQGLWMVGQDAFSVGLVAVLASGALTTACLSKTALAILFAEMILA